jgi:hypothetical protein
MNLKVDVKQYQHEQPSAGAGMQLSGLYAVAHHAWPIACELISAAACVYTLPIFVAVMVSPMSDRRDLPVRLVLTLAQTQPCLTQQPVSG